jgi:hypothetical protein
MRARYPDSEGLLVRDITGLAGQPVSYRNVETDGAARAAQLIAELI